MAELTLRYILYPCNIMSDFLIQASQGFDWRTPLDEVNVSALTCTNLP